MAKPIINTRVGNDQLTWQELDDNFTNLQNATISITTNNKSHAVDLNDTFRFTEGSNIVLDINSSGELVISASAAPYTLPTATTTTLGGVKADGTTITVAGDGTLSASSATFTTIIKQTVKNMTGGTLYKGQPVYISGANGQNITVALASASSEGTSSKTIGLLEADIANNGTGYVITNGQITGVTTQSANVGDPVWLSPTAGQLVFGLANKPTAPYHMVYIGVVEYAGTSNGKILISIQNGFEINELHNVDIGTLANNDFLTYNSSTSLWENKQLSSSLVTGALGYTPYTSGGVLGTPASGDLTNCSFPVASTTVSGTVKVDGTTVTITNGVISAAGGGGSYTLPTASTSTLGGVKIDNVTVKIDGSGVLTADEQVRVRVYNSTGSTLIKGWPVRQRTSNVGAILTGDNVPIVTLGATGGTTGSLNALIGLVESDIPNESYGWAIVNGYITGINTNWTNEQALIFVGSTFSNSGTLYLSATRGIGYSYPVAAVGYVYKKHTTDGIIRVDMSPYPKLRDLPDVKATNPSNGQFLQWNSIDNHFEFVTLSSTYILPTASDTTLGGVKVGIGLSIDGGGSLNATQYSLPTASSTVLGGIKIDNTTLTISNGVVTATQYSLPTASNSVLGGVKVDNTSITISNGVISATPTTLPTASDSVLGGVKVGSGLTIDGSGVLTATAGSYTLPTASDSVLGGVKVDGSSIIINDGVISATGGGGGSYTLPTASISTLGGVKIDGSTITISNGVITATQPTPYSLPTASNSTLGGIKIGSGLSIDGNGVVTASGGGTGGSESFHPFLLIGA